MNPLRDVFVSAGMFFLSAAATGIFKQPPLLAFKINGKVGNGWRNLHAGFSFGLE
jgi:hypothetical protein